mgnify:CR=1 FL=1
MEDYVRLREVKKIYKMGEVEIAAADGIDFSVGKGEFAVVVGASGAGKTTVLNILGGMDTATSGEVIVDGNDITTYNTKQLTAYRRDDIGFVFQFYNLVPNLTALENVELALQICKDPLDAMAVLEDVGLGERAANFPAQLSGGEQQRVSIARALAKNPKLLLCDEPTGALDYNTGKAILKLLQDTCRKKGMTVILITHNSAIAPMADRVIKIKNGKVSKVTLNENPISVETIVVDKYEKTSVEKRFLYGDTKKPGTFFVDIFYSSIGRIIFSGIRASEPDMRISGDAYFDEKNLMDIKVISTMGLTKDDLHAIEGLSDVAKAEGGFSQDMLLNIDDNQKVLHVMSIPESMNELTVSEGRMPEKEGECLVDIDFLEGTSYRIGDTITLTGENSGILEVKEFKIVGTGSSRPTSRLEGEAV